MHQVLPNLLWRVVGQSSWFGNGNWGSTCQKHQPGELRPNEYESLPESNPIQTLHKWMLFVGRWWFFSKGLLSCLDLGIIITPTNIYVTVHKHVLFSHVGKVTENRVKVQLQIELCPSDRALFNWVVLVLMANGCPGFCYTICVHQSFANLHPICVWLKIGL